MGESKPGHARDYLKAWEEWLIGNGKEFAILHFGVTEVRSQNRILRLKQFILNFFESIFFLYKLFGILKRDGRILLLDSPCSYPIVPRQLFRFLASMGLRKRMFAVCHSFPLSGDAVPDLRVQAWAGRHFKIHRLLIHSRAIRKYFIENLSIPPERIIETNWGCEPVKAVKYTAKPDKLILLFFGQYRSSKGLEWCWNALQDLQISCDFVVRISVPPETGDEVAVSMRREPVSGRHGLLFEHKRHFNAEEISKSFENVDLLVVPYSREHCIVSGLVYLAASFGCPVVSSHHSESAEIPMDHGFGYLFPPGDAGAFRECLLKYHQETDKERLRNNAIRFARASAWSKEIEKEWQDIHASR
jgi:glycosyltransferase involved in cell wall biosynthesis